MWSLQKAYRNMSNQLLWSGEPPPHVLEQQSATSFPPIERLFSDFQRTLLKPHRRSHFLVKPHLMASHPPVLMQTIGGIPPPPPPPPPPFFFLFPPSQGNLFSPPRFFQGGVKMVWLHPSSSKTTGDTPPPPTHTSLHLSSWFITVRYSFLPPSGFCRRW